MIPVCSSTSLLEDLDLVGQTETLEIRRVSFLQLESRNVRQQRDHVLVFHARFCPQLVVKMVKAHWCMTVGAMSWNM